MPTIRDYACPHLHTHAARTWRDSPPERALVATASAASAGGDHSLRLRSATGSPLVVTTWLCQGVTHGSCAKGRQVCLVVVLARRFRSCHHLSIVSCAQAVMYNFEDLPWREE